MKNFKPNELFELYLYWCCERMNIFWKRQRGESWPYTDDEILQQNKFTNVYRALDRVSQYLIGDVIYNEKGLKNEYDTEDIFWRIMLFKHFNKIETWQSLEKEFGDITLDVDLDSISKFLTSKVNSGEVVYSNAYMMTASFMKNETIKNKYGIKNDVNKHDAYLQIFKNGVLMNGYIYEILKSKTFAELFEKFNGIITVGKFLAQQYSIDLNYSILFDFDEDDFIIAGPGAERGIERCFVIEGKPDYPEIIRWVKNNFNNLMNDYGFNFIPLPNRDLKLIDVQNCFCEVDKYIRGMGIEQEGVKGSRIKNRFSELSMKKDIKYVFPPKWNVKI